MFLSRGWTTKNHPMKAYKRDFFPIKSIDISMQVSVFTKGYSLGDFILYSVTCVTPFGIRTSEGLTSSFFPTQGSCGEDNGRPERLPRPDIDEITVSLCCPPTSRSVD